MTLAEYVGVLYEHHRAAKEYRELLSLSELSRHKLRITILVEVIEEPKP